MKTIANIQFREPANLNELQSLFSLRYQVYKEDKHLNSMLSAVAHDFTTYDLNALHFGAFEKEKPVAYLRLAVEEKTHLTPWVEELLEREQIALEDKTHAFPFQAYHPDPLWSDRFLQEFSGKRIGEVGRLAIHPDYRQAGHVLDGLISSFICYCKEDRKINAGFGTCTLLLERYYRKFGFQRAKNCRPFVYQNLPEAVVVCFEDR